MRAIETNRRRIVSRLAREGWLMVRRGGDHDIYRHAQKQGAIAVPRQSRLSPGVARSIGKAAGWL